MTQLSGSLRRLVVDLLSIVVLVVGLVLLFPEAAHRFNPDAIGYYGLSRHWANGTLSLAISGYWGPLLSWIMVSVDSWFSDAAAASRAATFVGAIVFQLGSIAFFRLGHYGFKWYVLATFVTAFASVNWWANGPITPDLLLSGLLLGGFAFFQRCLRSGDTRSAVCAGLLFGLSYLAKTPGLPLSIGFMLALGFLDILLRNDRAFHPVTRQFSITAIAMLFIVAPWVTTLSIHYGKFTWTATSDSAIYYRLNNSHPVFETYKVPKIGRISNWEEPGETNFDNQLKVGISEIRKVLIANLYDISRHVKSFDFFGLLFPLTLLAFLWRRDSYSGHLGEGWRLGLVGVVVVVIPYFLTYAAQQRYFWVCFPFMVGASLGFLGNLERNALLAWPGSRIAVVSKRLLPTTVYVLIGFSIVSTNYGAISRSLAGSRYSEYDIAKMIVANVREKSGLGPIVSVARGGSQVDLYTAFIGKVPSYGRKKTITNVEEITSLDPRFVFVQINHKALSLLEKNQLFIDRTDAFVPTGDDGRILSDMRIFELVK